MSTRFYAGQQDYIIQLNLMDDEFDAAVASVTGKANSDNGVFTGVTTMPRRLVNRASNVINGTQWYNSSNHAWATYMAQGGDTATGPYGIFTAVAGTLVTGWSIRNVALNSASSGWIWEKNETNGLTPVVVAEIRASDGAARFAGTVTAPTFSGALSGTATNATNVGITNDTTTNATMYVSWVTGTSGNLPQKVTNTKLTFNPSTGTLSSTTFSGALSGNATSSTTTAITDDVSTAVAVYPMWTTAGTGNLAAKVSTSTFSFVPQTGSLSLSGTGFNQLSMNRTNNTINCSVSYTTTSGTLYAGHGAANTFAVGGSSDLTSSPWMTVTSSAATMAGNLTVNGNLTINGTTTTVNSTTVTIDDPVMTLGGDTAPGSDDNKDRGIEYRWHNGTSAKLGFFGYDDSVARFTFIPDATETGGVYSGTVGTIGANLVGNVTGAVTGNASTATTLATARNITLSGDVTGTASFNGSADATITAVVVDDSHNHTISTVTGLQTALDAKYDKTGGVIGNQTTGWADVGTPTARVVGVDSATGGGLHIESYQPKLYFLDRTASAKSTRLKVDAGTLYIGNDDGTLNDVWNEQIRISGDGYMAMGGSLSSDVKYYARGTNVGIATNQYNFFGATEFNESATLSGVVYQATPTVKDAVFTMGNLIGFRASNPTVGAQATVTAYDGFQVINPTAITGSPTRVSGYYSNVASGTNRWNAYMTGSASNYFNGKVQIGSVTDTGEKLQVTGTAKFTDDVTITTQPVGDNSTLAASTAFTQQAAADAAIVYSIVFG